MVDILQAGVLRPVVAFPLLIARHEGTSVPATLDEQVHGFPVGIDAGGGYAAVRIRAGLGLLVRPRASFDGFFECIGRVVYPQCQYLDRSEEHTSELQSRP